MYKYAFNAADAERVVGILKPKMIRRGLNPSFGKVPKLGIKQTGAMAAVPYAPGQDIKGILKKNDPQVQDAYRSMYSQYGGKIFQPAGGVMRQITKLTRGKPEGKRFKEVFGRMAPHEKKMFNQIGIAHEGEELAASNRGAGFSGHQNVGVPLKENNMIATLPEGYENVRTAYTMMRDIGNESKELGIRYGAGRVSRPHQRVIAARVNAPAPAPAPAPAAAAPVARVRATGVPLSPEMRARVRSLMSGRTPEPAQPQSLWQRIRNRFTGGRVNVQQ